MTCRSLACALVLAVIVAPPLAEACSHPEFRDFTPASGSCGALSRLKIEYTPAKYGVCALDMNVYQCCDITTIPKLRRETQWTDPGCGGPKVGYTGWESNGTTTNATSRMCF